MAEESQSKKKTVLDNPISSYQNFWPKETNIMYVTKRIKIKVFSFLFNYQYLIYVLMLSFWFWCFLNLFLFFCSPIYMWICSCFLVFPPVFEKNRTNFLLQSPYKNSGEKRNTETSKIGRAKLNKEKSRCVIAGGVPAWKEVGLHKHAQLTKSRRCRRSGCTLIDTFHYRTLWYFRLPNPSIRAACKKIRITKPSVCRGETE